MIKSAFELEGRVEAVLLARDFGSIVSTPVDKIQLIRGHGVRGDNHAGVRLADVREKAFLSFGFSKGAEIANYREFSAVSTEELAQIAKAMNLRTAIPLGCLGENLVLSGIPKLSELPTGTMLFFRKDEQQIRTTVLVVWSENTPCQAPGQAIQDRFSDIPGLARLFPKAAIGKRGVVGSVYSSGNIHVGDTVIAKIPRQRIYDPLG
jgi:hypothetical protein